MQVHMLDHLNMTVADVDASADWYGRLFGFHPVEEGQSRGHRYQILKSGEAVLCIYEHPERSSAATHDDDTHTINHFGVRIADRRAWEEVVAREGVPLEFGGPIEWPHSTAWYVRDPSGYSIEVALWHGGRATFGPAPESAPR